MPAQHQLVLIGLGNPGDMYAHTRHNAGALVIEALLEQTGRPYAKSLAGCDVYELTVTLNGNPARIVCARPQTAMNLSGGPTSKLLARYQLSAAELVVIHDELDLPQGEARIKQGGGLNGHNGLKSIAQKLGTQDFRRLQVGISRPPGKMPVATYVLQQLNGGHFETFHEDIYRAADVLTHELHLVL